MNITKCTEFSSPLGDKLGIRLIDSEGMMFESEAQCAKYHNVNSSVINECSTISKPLFTSKKLNKKIAVICISEGEYNNECIFDINEELLKHASNGIHCYINDNNEIKNAIKLPKEHILYKGGNRWARQIEDDPYGWDVKTGTPLKVKTLSKFLFGV